MSTECVFVSALLAIQENNAIVYDVGILNGNILRKELSDLAI